ncbi:MAG: DUF952 domain-containing protein [Parvibaculales bacterium]
MLDPQQPAQQTDYIYKICAREDWELACEKKIFSGVGIDIDDGFIHFSAVHQIEGTAKKYFLGQKNLILLQVPVNQLSNTELVWEASRGGEHFPHLYGALLPQQISQIWDFLWDSECQPVLAYADGKTKPLAALKVAPQT